MLTRKFTKFFVAQLQRIKKIMHVLVTTHTELHIQMQRFPMEINYCSNVRSLL